MEDNWEPGSPAAEGKAQQLAQTVNQLLRFGCCEKPRQKHAEHPRMSYIQTYNGHTSCFFPPSASKLQFPCGSNWGQT